MTRNLLLVPALVLLTGCAGTGFNAASFQNDVRQGNVASALERLDDYSDEDVAALLDRGLLLQSQDRFEESNAVFAKAETLIGALHARSVSTKALALLTNDRALGSRPSGFECADVAYNRAWNYLEMGLREDVLVEARRINERLTFRSDSCEDEGGACGHDTFLRYFSGLLFEWGGEWNDAYVAYKQADIARKTAEIQFGAAAPPDLGVRLVRLARRLGFDDEAERWAAEYGVDPNPDPRASTLVVLWENGMIGHREAASVLIPIYQTETRAIAKDRDAWSHTLAERRHGPRNTKVKLDYLLRISLPTYVATLPAGDQAEVVIGGAKEPSTLRRVAPLSAMAAHALDSAMGGIAVRAVSRALVKYLAKQAVDKNIGEGAGFLVNLLGVALEQADTRSWRSLPYEIDLASREVPPGSYDVRLNVTGPGGRVVETQVYSQVRVNPGGITFIRHRSY